MKIYVASSWRNFEQPDVVYFLRTLGHDVYDFRHPPRGEHLGFSWSDVDPDWKAWNVDQYVAALDHPIAQAGFDSDYSAMEWADVGVLVLPCGKSAHLEAGYFNGARKPLYIILADDWSGGVTDTELMYKMATHIFRNHEDFVSFFPLSELVS